MNTESHKLPPLRLRCEIKSTDREAVLEIVRSTGFFNEAEARVAVELVEERLARGEESGYHFVFAELEGAVAGYACFGPIPCTQWSFDLYWIAVDPQVQGHGAGKKLVREVERLVREMGGTRVYIETSNRPLYKPTRAFYDRCEYSVAAVLEEFYGPSDDKVIFVKRIA